MKAKLAVWGTLFVASFGWAAPQEFTFVTTLSAPVASFKEIETQYAGVPTEFGNNAEVNLGSSKSGTGEIHIEGGNPVRINQLEMEENTTFSVGDDKKWIVDELTIGKDGEVEAQSAHIQTLEVPSGSTLTVKGNLIMPGQIELSKAGSGVKMVRIGDPDNPSFKVESSLAAGTGNFKSLRCSDKNVEVGTCSATESKYVLVVN